MGIYGNNIILVQEYSSIESINFTIFENDSFENLFDEFDISVNESFDGIKGTIKRKIEKLIEMIKEFIRKIKTKFYMIVDKDKLVIPYWDFYKKNKSKFDIFFASPFIANYMSDSTEYDEKLNNIKAEFDKIKDKKTTINYTLNDIEKESKEVMKDIKNTEKDIESVVSGLGDTENKFVKAYIFRLTIATFMMDILKLASLELKPEKKEKDENKDKK